MEKTTDKLSTKELRLIYAQRLAVLDLVLHALVETHPDKPALARAFTAKMPAAKSLMTDLALANFEDWTQPQAIGLPSVFQQRLNDDLAAWQALLTQEQNAANK